MDVRDILRWLLFIAWGTVILWFSLIALPPVVKADILGWDKFQHAVAYGVFTILAGRAFICFRVSRMDMTKRWLKATILAVIFGGLIEIAQTAFTETRTAELGDLLADAAGAGFVYGAVMIAPPRYLLHKCLSTYWARTSCIRSGGGTPK